MGRRSLPSLRLWLQSTTVLAVLAGYALLLVLNDALADLQRLRAHQDLIEEVRMGLQAPIPTSREPAISLQQQMRPGLQLTLLQQRRNEPPRMESLGDQTLMVSTTLLDRPGEPGLALVVQQNVSASVEREWLSQLLLIAAAGGSTLLTSALLRPVLRRGLVQPLADLCAQLDATQAPPAPPVLVDEASQPAELRPIAAAFNGMQARLATSWEQQRAFVDGVAHELRTPLTLISGHAQRLLKQASAADLHADAAALHLLVAESQRMGLLVSDLLDLARQDAGRLQVVCAPLNPEDALLECFERLTASSGGRLQLVATEASAALPLAWADPDRLQQCLVALIDNALRYSPAPRPVRLSAVLHERHLALHVIDQGPGVEPSEREAIFERFVRGSAALNTRGSGIGLSVVRHLVEAMGGSVQVQEAPGGGADFRICLCKASIA